MRCPESRNGEEHCFCGAGGRQVCCFCHKTQGQIHAEGFVDYNAYFKPMTVPQIVPDFDDDGSEENLDYEPKS